MVSTVTRDELKEKIIRGDKFYLIEIESDEHVRSIHIPGSLRIPLGEIEELASKILLNRSAELVFFCQDAACPCGREALAKFTSMGYESIHHYREGVRGWVNAGLPFESEAA